MSLPKTRKPSSPTSHSFTGHRRRKRRNRHWKSLKKNGIGNIRPLPHRGEPTGRESLDCLHSANRFNHLYHERIASLNYSLRKVIKNRSLFPNDESVFNLLYPALKNLEKGVEKKWTIPIRHWGQVINQFAIPYENRIPLS